MARRWNARAGETVVPRENPSASGIVQHDSHMRKSGSEPAADRTRIAAMGGERPSHCKKKRTRPANVLMIGKAAVAGRLDCSPPNHGETGSIHRQVGIVPDDGAGRRVFSGNSRFTRPFVPALLHTRLTSPSSVLKTFLFSAAQISSLTYRVLCQICALLKIPVYLRNVLRKCTNEKSSSLFLQERHGGVLPYQTTELRRSGPCRCPRHDELPAAYPFLALSLLPAHSPAGHFSVALLKKKGPGGRCTRNRRLPVVRDRRYSPEEYQWACHPGIMAPATPPATSSTRPPHPRSIAPLQHGSRVPDSLQEQKRIQSSLMENVASAFKLVDLVNFRERAPGMLNDKIGKGQLGFEEYRGKGEGQHSWCPGSREAQPGADSAAPRRIGYPPRPPLFLERDALVAVCSPSGNPVNADSGETCWRHRPPLAS
ncbi:hypothetical protein PR048_024850 [Dryococelus australis]|uniref:Uncharacterized protein n=1 Tax=Dryococelus australis TaxID=614101 RepID=A0ABQ9GPQ6_9NEOP|nr:hypothetical protein PR048_024850 [Dryococelus australis]